MKSVFWFLVNSRMKINLYKSIIVIFFLDDLWSEAISNKEFSLLCTFGSRKSHCSMIMTTQNIYDSNGSFGTTIKRQFNYFCLFWSYGDKTYLHTFSRQIFPSHPLKLIQCFELLMQDMEHEKHWQNYLLVDANPASPMASNLRIRTNVFSHENHLL